MLGVEIRRLPVEVVNRIAAGEVIRRPVNAVKELIENSLDAGSSSISITVKGGGIKYLSIMDNGKGITKEDLKIICERFTTSKLKSYTDLTKGKISTFGFRGEALASISHVVHHLTIQTTRRPPPPLPNEDPNKSSNAACCSWKCSYADGKVIDGPTLAPTSSSKVGTIITYEDLFYNIGARLRALGSHNQEYQLILTLIQMYALHFPFVKFTVQIFGNRFPDLLTPGRPSTDVRRLQQRICSSHDDHPSSTTTTTGGSPSHQDFETVQRHIVQLFFGVTLTRELLSVSFVFPSVNHPEKYPLLLTGPQPPFISDPISLSDQNSTTTCCCDDENHLLGTDPDYSAELESNPVYVRCRALVSNPNYFSKKLNFILFINDRYVQCPPLKRALLPCYAELLPRNHHPFMYLSLDLNPKLIDVNVHPTKEQVHFLHQDFIINLLVKQVQAEICSYNRCRTFITSAPLTGSICRSTGSARLPVEKGMYEEKRKGCKEETTVDIHTEIDRTSGTTTKNVETHKGNGVDDVGPDQLSTSDASGLFRVKDFVSEQDEEPPTNCLASTTPVENIDTLCDTNQAKYYTNQNITRNGVRDTGNRSPYTLDIEQTEESRRSTTHRNQPPSQDELYSSSDEVSGKHIIKEYTGEDSIQSNTKNRTSSNDYTKFKGSTYNNGDDDGDGYNPSRCTQLREYMPITSPFLVKQSLKCDEKKEKKILMPARVRTDVLQSTLPPLMASGSSGGDVLLCPDVVELRGKVVVATNCKRHSGNKQEEEEKRKGDESVGRGTRPLRSISPLLSTSLPPPALGHPLSRVRPNCSPPLSSSSSPPNESDASQLRSVVTLLGNCAACGSPALTRTVTRGTLIGAVDRQFALLQHESSLYLIHITKIVKECIYQSILTRIGRLPYLLLRPALPLRLLLAGAALIPGSGYQPEGKHKGITTEFLANELACILELNAELLADYFSIRIENDTITAFPFCCGDYFPGSKFFPFFFLKLAAQINWEEEECCLCSISLLIADFYGNLAPEESPWEKQRNDGVEAKEGETKNDTGSEDDSAAFGSTDYDDLPSRSNSGCIDSEPSSSIINRREDDMMNNNSMSTKEDYEDDETRRKWEKRIIDETKRESPLKRRKKSEKRESIREVGAGSETDTPATEVPPPSTSGGCKEAAVGGNAMEKNVDICEMSTSPTVRAAYGWYWYPTIQFNKNVILPARYMKDGTVVLLTTLERLYKVFERC